MSFATFLEIQHVDDAIDIDAIAPQVLAQLDEDGIHHDVLKNLRAAFAGAETLLNVSPDYVAYLVERIAAMQPHVAFHARGRGEELRDVWVREFSDGAATFSVGSFLE